MKLNKNFIIPLSLITGMFVILIAFQKMPAIPLISVLLFVFLPILFVQQKSNNDWGKMFIFGILLAIVFIVLLFGVLTLSNHYEWLKDIVLWPHNWRET